MSQDDPKNEVDETEGPNLDHIEMPVPDAFIESIPHLPNPGGRPSKFNPEYHPQAALALARKGFDLEMIAEAFDVHRNTLRNWIKDHPEKWQGAEKRLYQARRGHIKIQALRHVQGVNKSSYAGVILSRLREDGEDGHEYMDPSKTKVEHSGDGLMAIAAKLGGQSGIVSLKDGGDE